MIIVSSREFRDKQRNYLDKVDEGIEVLIRRGKNKSYKITAISDEDALMSEEEFFKKIDKAKEEIEQGKSTTIKTKEELMSFLDSL